MNVEADNITINKLIKIFVEILRAHYLLNECEFCM